MFDQDTLTQLLAEREITAVLNNYCQGVDRRDWDLARSSYFDEATDSHGAFKGGPDELIVWLKGRHEKVSSSAHLLTNVSIRFQEDGPYARVESYYFSHQIVMPSVGDPFAGASDEPVFIRVLGRYIDTFERREEHGWKIINRVCLNEWIHRSNVESLAQQDPSWPVPYRDKRDPLYAPFPNS